MSNRIISIENAYENNLNHVSLNIPHDRLVVITGVSGSGKSSLAFDTIHQEGQRRFMESLSSYARQFMGQMTRPKVDRITGLSPTICIDQKTVNRNPRSTVGTITECLDHFRLLLARLGTPHCPICDLPLALQSAEQLAQNVIEKHGSDKSKTIVHILAPIVQDRKGEYRKELAQAQKQGFVRARINGSLHDLDTPITLARYEKHTIELGIDRTRIRPKNKGRIIEAIEQALTMAKGTVSFLIGEQYELHSSKRSCPEHGISAPELEPRLFSFNAPQGMCMECSGIGYMEDFDLSLLIKPSAKVLDAFLPMQKSGVLPFTEIDKAVVKSICKKNKISISQSWSKLSEEQKNILLYGCDLVYSVQKRGKTITRKWAGLINRIKRVWHFTKFPHFRPYRARNICSTCSGSRLNPVALAVRFHNKNIDHLSKMTISEALSYTENLILTPSQKTIAAQLVRALHSRLVFLNDVGLSYLSFDRSAASLSGGEAQRIRLAAQVGSGLQGVTFVLDEPSIGLHHRDQKRLIRALIDLRDKGNSLIVVEHDPLMMAAADYLIEVGPGAGSKGGDIVYAGTASRFWKSKAKTAQYLRGECSIPTPTSRRNPTKKFIEVLGANAFNLKNVHLKIPLQLFCVITGVSGSGKSTLIEHTLCAAIQKKLNKSKITVGEYERLKGLKHIDKLVTIDQSPIGRNPRSNPATYTGMMTHIRNLFAQTIEANRRGYTKSRFSFNTQVEKGGGRCQECEGAGIKTIEMQFLANVEIPCDSCMGKRFNQETLDVMFKGKNIHEILDMSVDEAIVLFDNQRSIKRTLTTLQEVGLGYITLGQPSTTLSGGEAQRIKLASELQKSSRGNTLYVLDEPTTGLHMDDVAKLLNALHRLVDAGNSVIVIEHDLDVIRSADWIIDMGPEGGYKGGTIIATGTPESIAKNHSPTGIALQDNLLPNHERITYPIKKNTHAIKLHGASIHNLKNISVDIETQSLCVITGPSGSGKTSLAFDTLFAEGQRRYVESLSTYARRFLGRMQRPPLEDSQGLAPAIAIDQKSGGYSPRSTVATTTEIYDYFRLLFARIGTPHCVLCTHPLLDFKPHSGAKHLRSSVQTPGWLVARIEGKISAGALIQAGYVRVLNKNHVQDTLENPKELLNNPIVVVDRLNPSKSSMVRLSEAITQAYTLGNNHAVFIEKKTSKQWPLYSHLHCPNHGISPIQELTPRHFSFNTHLGSCPSCAGLGKAQEINMSILLSKPDQPSWEAIHGWVRRGFYSPKIIKSCIASILSRHSFSDTTPYNNLSTACQNEILYGINEPIDISYQRGQRTINTTKKFIGIVPEIQSWNRELSWLRTEQRCLRCDGKRLREEVRSVSIADHNISDCTAMTIQEACTFWENITLTPNQQKVAQQAQIELKKRLRFLNDVGLGYLTLDRSARTLSGGESQRIRLASQLGSGLSRSIYVLDEPTVGLHHADTEALLGTLKELVALNNTVVVVEHDEQMIRAADQVIDMGPAAGVHGGEVVANAHPKDLSKGSTFEYLTGVKNLPKKRSRKKPKSWITIKNASTNNLKNITVSFPRAACTVVTGPSGAGKSTLVMQELLPRITEKIQKKHKACPKRVEVVNQRPIGSSPRSTPASYCDILGPIRELFAQTKEARTRGWTKKRFSYNGAQGRCPHCEGRGYTLIEMHFLSDIWLPCEECSGTRYSSETREALWKGLSISDVLSLTVDEACVHFANHKSIFKKLEALSRIGLGYLQLSQPANQLSGGEAQRMKLAKYLAKGERAHETCFILDEPSTGLHFSDIALLLKTMNELVDAGHMLVVIEHNLDLISHADYLIDIGPVGGSAGGELLHQADPMSLTKDSSLSQSKTISALKEHLATR